ncbi:putative n-myc downstream regulated [Fasciola hepatica]|uniref:N-myc downstream regulated n=1 Tax=Fasciola hepatica TaxID=6192 RepID=A0A4E0RY40_FASHE|nr:putative n-myc downstream regulated [Fasciola hepatica]
MAGLGMANEVHHEVITEAAGSMNVYVQGTLVPNKPVFMTVHDLGCNHYQYEDFMGNPKMAPIRQRAAWLHIDLPGQGDGEEELPASYQFPPIHKLPEAMKAILDHFNIKQVVLFGEGAGANILARFAIMYDSLVLGAILIHCTGQSASFAQAIKDKVSMIFLSQKIFRPVAQIS